MAEENIGKSIELMPEEILRIETDSFEKMFNLKRDKIIKTKDLIDLIDSRTDEKFDSEKFIKKNIVVGNIDIISWAEAEKYNKNMDEQKQEKYKLKG